MQSFHDFPVIGFTARGTLRELNCPMRGAVEQFSPVECPRAVEPVTGIGERTRIDCEDSIQSTEFLSPDEQS